MAKKWTPPATEVVNYVTATPWASSGTLKLYPPSLLSLKGMSLANIRSERINTSMFVNNSSCMPNASNTLSIQNFVTAKGPYGGSFDWQWLAYGATVKVNYEGDDMETVVATTVIDNSFYR